ncbi:MAG: hypothetical protein DRI86_13005 [Bacteroidetes bacterium]|nr:MAG: hypothetical protein DRI86_13005 [Bacteroidota bacterium]
MKIKKQHISSSNKALVIIAIFSMLFIWAVRWNGISGNNYKNIIRSDGNGYYHYFEALFGEESIDNQQENGIFLVKTKNDRVVNKYFVGTALLMSPFVMPVYLIQKSLGLEIDLRSEYYQKSISIAALFYLILGLWAISKLLSFYDIDDRIIAFALFAIFFGTNLSYYALIGSSMSHVYSFSLISVFLMLFKKQVDSFQAKRLLILSVLLALIVLIRPLNILIVLFLPFISSSFDNFYQLIRKKAKTFPINIIAILVLGLIIFIQLLFWKFQTGNWIVWSYSNEGFYFFNPHLIDFLFSFRKGLFIYSPFLFLCLLVFVVVYRKKKHELLLSFVPILFIFYMLSSWWNWYYGDSYGSRVIIDYLPVFVLLFALGMQKMHISKQRIVVLLASLFVILNVFQSYQYYHNIMSHFDMNASKYACIFGRVGEKYENSLGGNDDIVSYHKKPLQIIYQCDNYIDSVASLQLIDSENLENFENGEYGYLFKKRDKYGLNIRISADELKGFDKYYLEFSNNVLLNNGDMKGAYWILVYTDSLNQNYHSARIKVNEIPLSAGEEYTNFYKLNLPRFKSEKDNLNLYIQTYSEAEFIVSDLGIKISGTN